MTPSSSARECLQDADYTPGPIGAEGPGTGFTIEAGYTAEDRAFLSTYAVCEQEYMALVTRAHAAQDH